MGTISPCSTKWNARLVAVNIFKVGAFLCLLSSSATLLAFTHFTWLYIQRQQEWHHRIIFFPFYQEKKTQNPPHICLLHARMLASVLCVLIAYRCSSSLSCTSISLWKRSSFFVGAMGCEPIKVHFILLLLVRCWRDAKKEKNKRISI